MHAFIGAMVGWVMARGCSMQPKRLPSSTVAPTRPCGAMPAATSSRHAVARSRRPRVSATDCYGASIGSDMLGVTRPAGAIAAMSTDTGKVAGAAVGTRSDVMFGLEGPR
jgi:hypothetical protein